MRVNAKRKNVLERIQHLEAAIAKGHEYLETGRDGHWQGFKPWFTDKVRDGKTLPAHKDWVRNVFLPRHEKALRKAENVLEEIDQR